MSRYAECRICRYLAARAGSCADMATDSQIDCQVARYAGKMTIRCLSSSADIPDNGRYAFRQADDQMRKQQMHVYQNRLAE